MNKVYGMCFLLFIVGIYTGMSMFNNSKMSEFMQDMLMVTFYLTILLAMITLSGIDSWLYCATIGRITLSECPKFKPRKRKIISVITTNNKIDVEERVCVKVLLYGFWFNLGRKETSTFDGDISRPYKQRTFKSLEEAHEFMHKYMKPVEKVYNVA